MTIIKNMISVEGLLLPNKPLTNFELLDAVKTLQIPRFRGVFMRDDLPTQARHEECGILNLDNVSGRGTHWVCWYKRARHKFYFDSFGVQPPEEVNKYLNSPLLYNTEQLQSYNQVICGHLCLFVLRRLSNGENYQKVINELH